MVTVKNADNPLIIDQCYSTPADVCAQFRSTLTISDVHCASNLSLKDHELASHLVFSVINVTGTSSGKEGRVVVDMECSAACTDITATGTDISSPKGPAEYICANIASESQVRVPSCSEVMISIYHSSAA